jgi:hypothetical protein
MNSRTCKGCAKSLAGLGRGSLRMCKDCRPTLKWCNKCDRVLPRAGFVLRTGALVCYCAECRGKQGAAWDSANPDYHYRYHLQRKFDVTAERAAELCTVTHCECCGVARGERRFSVDHDHATNAIRGVVCQRCNLLIGAAEDPGLPDAIRYLSIR